MRFNPSRNNLGNQFILGVAKAYKSEVFKVRGICTLRDKAKVGGVNSRVQLTRVESVYTKLNSGLAQNIPVPLEHKMMYTIRTSIFIRLKGEQGSLNPRMRKRTVKHLMIIQDEEALRGGI